MPSVTEELDFQFYFIFTCLSHRMWLVGAVLSSAVELDEEERGGQAKPLP